MAPERVRAHGAGVEPERPLTVAEQRAYVAGGGALRQGIQGRATAFIERLGGSYSGIIGLPLCETATLLNRLGFLRPEACAGGGGSA